MKERPILFSAAMVRAIGCGDSEHDKTQTRRIIKPQPEGELRPLSEWSHSLAAACCATASEAEVRRHGEKLEGRIFPFLHDGHMSSPWCPYGAPGDRLWVRESFWVDSETGAFKWYVNDIFTPDRKADRCKLKPGIFMRRNECRVLLEITRVRVERVEDISEEDAIAEGAKTLPAPEWFPTWKRTFLNLFYGINPKATGTNPWVWVIDFKKIPTTFPNR